MFQFSSKKVRLNGAADSFQGGRSENQDNLAYCDTPLGFLMVVCDGMGGGPGGKTASTIAVKEIVRTLSTASKSRNRAQLFRQAAGTANEAIEEAIQNDVALSGMGTTFVAILIDEHSAYVAHAGDSRCYKLRGKHIMFRTQDHSLVGELMRRKVLTEEEARTSPQSNVITHGLGSTTNHVPDIEEITYYKGDRFVLCTDGVWGIMPQPELLTWLGNKSKPSFVLSPLATEIERRGRLSGGNHDNFTMAIIDMEMTSLKARRKLWRLGSLALFCFFIIVMSIFIVNELKNNNQSSEQTSYVVTNGISMDTPHGASDSTSNSALQINHSAENSSGTDSSTLQKNATEIKKNEPHYIQAILDNIDSLKSCKEPEESKAKKRQDSLFSSLKNIVQNNMERSKKEKDNDTIKILRTNIHTTIKNNENIIKQGIEVTTKGKTKYYIPNSKASLAMDTIRYATEKLQEALKQQNLKRDYETIHK